MQVLRHSLFAVATRPKGSGGREAGSIMHCQQTSHALGGTTKTAQNIRWAGGHSFWLPSRPIGCVIVDDTWYFRVLHLLCRS